MKFNTNAKNKENNKTATASNEHTLLLFCQDSTLE